MIHSKLSVVLPFFNEKPSLRSAVITTIDKVRELFTDFELILIDDGSNDDPDDILEDLRETYKEVLTVKNHVNLNQGISMQRGFIIARGEYVIHNGVDLPFNFEELRNFWDLVEISDIVVIERKRSEGYSKWRLLVSWANKTLRKTLFPFACRGICDMNFVQIYRKNILPEILPLAKSPAFTPPEMIIRAIKKGYRVNTVKCAYMPRKEGEAKMGRINDILWCFWDMLRYRVLSFRNCQNR